MKATTRTTPTTMPAIAPGAKVDEDLGTLGLVEALGLADAGRGTGVVAGARN